jgi:hypothetical protein
VQAREHPGNHGATSRAGRFYGVGGNLSARGGCTNGAGHFDVPRLTGSLSGTRTPNILIAGDTVAESRMRGQEACRSTPWNATTDGETENVQWSGGGNFPGRSVVVDSCTASSPSRSGTWTSASFQSLWFGVSGEMAKVQLSRWVP